MSSLPARRVLLPLTTQVARQVPTLSQQTRDISTSSVPMSYSAPPSVSSSANPLHSLGGAVSAIARPGGRQSVSGIVATVFGATGFLGRYTVNALGRVGSQVVVPYRGDGQNARHLKIAGDLGQIVPLPYDLKDIESVKRVISKSNVVINLVGNQFETGHYSYDDTQVKVTYRLAQVAKSLGVEKFIHVSHLGADRHSPSAFYRSKAEGEEVVRSFYPDATIFRPATIFGAQDRFLNYYCAISDKLYGVPITRDGMRLLQPVYVADVARAILNSVTDPTSKGQIYELAGPHVFTERQIIDLCQRFTQWDIKTVNLSERAAKLYGWMVGGRRNWNTRFPTLNVVLGRMALPEIFHPDLVEQRKVDLVLAPGSQNGLDLLGVEKTPLSTQVEDILIAHLKQFPNRFPDSVRTTREVHEKFDPSEKH